MRLRYRRAYALPGVPFEVEATLVSSVETPVDAIVFALVGHEFWRAGEHSNCKQLFRLTANHEPYTLTPGEHRFRSTFLVPPNVPASYQGGYCQIEYWLQVHVDIPWWPDLNENYVIPMGWIPGMPAPMVPAVFHSLSGHAGNRPYIEISLESTVVEYQGNVRGRVSMTNASNVSSVTVQAIRSETIHGGVPLEIPLVGGALGQGPPPEGESFPFRLTLPPNATPSYRGWLFEVRWYIEIVAYLLSGATEVVRAPIQILPPSGQPPPPRGWVAPVGKERRARSWRFIAKAHGLLCDDENERMTATFGAVSLTIGLEQRAAEGLYAVARLEWPALGLDLRIEERKWTDMLRSDDVELGEVIFDSAFVATGRDREQLRSWLSVDFAPSICGFAQASVRDDGALLLMGIHVITGDPRGVLSRFVAAAVHAAKCFGIAHDRVPPPPEMAAYEPVWRAFAERHGGRLERGRMWIHDATLGMDRFSIGTDWSGTPPTTLVRVPIDPPLTRPFEGDVSRLRAKVQDIHVGLDAVEVRLPAPLADPTTVEPILVEMVRLSRSARGLLENPFR
ncbi:hypothetical protein LVJ94_41290 [Pendulispora rubella]|uniref:Arrestin-like N-terminal domain-containing protein n=1 Tax=Pendulispora rubella TaxID=2741070 RepID=A0ABZ2L255_9BACT